jgi:hypothetical protein
MNSTTSQAAVAAAVREGANRPFGSPGNKRIVAAFASVVVSIALLGCVVLGMTATDHETAHVILAKR